MNLKNVKAIISLTECYKYISCGAYCSEPIMTKDNKGIIDNYFIFGRSADLSILEVPDICFGIYSEEKEVAYVNKSVSEMFEEKKIPESFDDLGSMRASYTKYVELYPEIRAMIKGEKNKEKDIINQYLFYLKNISGNALYRIYEKMYPGFFLWAQENI